MKNKIILKTTNNLGEFNRAYKKQLANEAKIHCSFCKYNEGENFSGNSYGGYDCNIKYPNWKLVSKNRKQWMNKKISIEETNGRKYKSIKW